MMLTAQQIVIDTLRQVGAVPREALLADIANQCRLTGLDWPAGPTPAEVVRQLIRLRKILDKDGLLWAVPEKVVSVTEVQRGLF